MSTRAGLNHQSKEALIPLVHEITPSMLVDPVRNRQQQEHYLGCGSFGVVRLQLYRGIYVAVKELLPRSLKEDVKHEAQIFARFCHPYLPHLFGVCTQTQPLRIVMQFVGFLENSQTLTLHRAQKTVIGHNGWLIVCAQI